MAKIIKPGKKKRTSGPWIGKKIKCTECGCCFTLEKGDRVRETFHSIMARSVRSAGLGMSTTYRRTIPLGIFVFNTTCPYCGDGFEFRCKGDVR